MNQLWAAKPLQTRRFRQSWFVLKGGTMSDASKFKLSQAINELNYEDIVEVLTEHFNDGGLLELIGALKRHIVDESNPHVPGHGLYKPREHDPVLEELEMKESYRDKVERQLKDGGPFKIKNECTCLGTQVPSSCSIHNPMFEENI
jgi:hypothetical protein